MPVPGLILALSALAGHPAAVRQHPEPPLKVAVLAIDLNNLHKTLPDSSCPDESSVLPPPSAPGSQRPAAMTS